MGKKRKRKRRKKQNQETYDTTFMRVLRIMFYLLIISFLIVGYRMYTDGMLIDKFLQLISSMMTWLESLISGVTAYVVKHPKESLVCIIVLTLFFSVGYFIGKRRN